VGGTRQRHFAGTNFKPRKLLENAQTPTRRVHAVLGNRAERKTHCPKQDTTAKLTKLLHATQILAITKNTARKSPGKRIAQRLTSFARLYAEKGIRAERHLLGC